MSSSRPAERRAPRRLLPVTLTSRLVAVVVALVAVVGVLVAVATAVGMRSYLTDKRDADLMQAFRREVGNAGAPDPRPCPLGTTVVGPDGRAGLPIGQGSGTLTVRPGCAFVVTGSRLEQVSTSAQRQLAAVPVDGRPHTVGVAGLGDYRVISDGSTITGLPMRDVQQAVRSLVWWELALTFTGVLLAGLAGTELVRRTLRPLRAVAQTAHAVTGQQLDTGAPSIRTRVPGELTDPATEVGQVGAALNTLLDHVDDALGARHRSEQQVRQFVADASHELRTPLATIHGYAELSRRAPGDADRLSTAMAKVETEADRMAALVEDLLLLARLDSGRPLVTEEVDVTRVLLEAVGDARVIAPNHRWRLDLPDEPLTARGDTARVHQVVTNLLTNARTHTPPGTTVLVAASAAGPHAEVQVHDDGPGLSPDLVPHAFERFTRGDSARTRTSGGAGLGLSLVSAIVTAQGGSVDLSSRPGATTFTVRLPR
jgi:two-component system OmpR family sensor kinase